MILVSTYFGTCLLFILISLCFIFVKKYKASGSTWVYAAKVVPASVGLIGIVFPFAFAMGDFLESRDLIVLGDAVFLFAAAICLALLGACLWTFARRNSLRHVYKIFALYAFSCTLFLCIATLSALSYELYYLFEKEPPSTDEAINPYRRVDIGGLFFYESQGVSVFTAAANLRIVFNSGKKVAILPHSAGTSDFKVYKLNTQTILFEGYRDYANARTYPFPAYIIDLELEKIYELSHDRTYMQELKTGETFTEGVFPVAKEKIEIAPDKLSQENLEFLGLVKYDKYSSELELSNKKDK